MELTPFYRHLIFPAQLKLGILQGHGEKEKAVPCQFLGALNLLSNFGWRYGRNNHAKTVEEEEDVDSRPIMGD